MACNFSTSQLPKVLRTWCFVHFDLEMCFRPQRCTLFEHLNFQKCSENGLFCNVLYILTSTCASHHNGVLVLISHLARWLCNRFSEPTFRPSGATNHWKNTVNRDFPTTFSRTCIFFPLTLFSSLIFFPLTPTAAFPSVHIVGSLTSKLPSDIMLKCAKYVMTWFNDAVKCCVKC